VKIPKIDMPAQRISEAPFRDHKYCPACGEETTQDLYCIKWNYPIVRCARCGLGLTEVQPEFNPAAIYSKEYFDGHRIDGYADYAGSEAVLRKEFRSALRKLQSTGGIRAACWNSAALSGSFWMRRVRVTTCLGWRFARMRFCHAALGVLMSPVAWLAKNYSPAKSPLMSP
jgi:hypothetical protein